MLAQSGGGGYVVNSADKTTVNDCMVPNDERMNNEGIDWHNLPVFSQVDNNNKRQITGLYCDRRVNWCWPVCFLLSQIKVKYVLNICFRK